jgi:peptide/nickel transport system permease protein
MLLYLMRRLLYMIPMLVLISILSFAVMQFQPGDFLTKYTLNMPQETVDQYRQLYGLNEPAWVQYFKWMEGIVTRWDFGRSFSAQLPVFDHLFVNGGRFWWTLTLYTIIFLFSWAIALPLGIYLATSTLRLNSAKRQDSSFMGKIGYFASTLGRRIGVGLTQFLGIVGLALPNFLTALLLMWMLVIVFRVGDNFGLGVGGLFDTEFRTVAWSWDKFVNFLWHLWPIVLVVGLGNMSQLIRYAKANLLDVLGEPYIQTARAKGLEERTIIYKHAVRNALNPLISLLGFWIPMLFEGMLVAAFVFDLPVVEKVFWEALSNEDQYVVMTGLLFFGFVLLIGNLLSDLLLALTNPKIRYE